MHRVLIVVTEAFHGGAGRYAVAVAEVLADAGAEVLLAHGGGQLHTAVADGRVNAVSSADLRRSLSPLPDYRAARWLAELKREFQPTLISAHTSKPGALVRLLNMQFAKTPVVYFPHGWSYRQASAVERPFYRAAEALLARVPSCITAVVSQAEASAAPSTREQGRALVMPPPYPLVRHYLDAGAAEQPQVAGALRVLMVGRFERPKRQDLLVEAVASLGGQVELTLVGGGPRLEDLRSQSARLGVEGRVRILPWSDEVNALYRQHHVAAHISDDEGMPIAVMEAMAAGLPVVGSAVGGVPELVTPSCAKLLDNNDPDRIADALAELAAPQERRSMADAGRRLIATRCATSAWRAQVMEVHMPSARCA